MDQARRIEANKPDSQIWQELGWDRAWIRKNKRQCIR